MDKKVIVKGGVDLRTGQLVINKGEYSPVDLLEGKTERLGKSGVRMWHVILVNQVSGEKYSFSFAQQMSIGRVPPSNEGETRLVVASDVMVSKMHALIYGAGNGLAIADYQSKNHTYVNGERVTMPRMLQQGDLIRVGRTEYQIMFGIS